MKQTGQPARFALPPFGLLPRNGPYRTGQFQHDIRLKLRLTSVESSQCDLLFLRKQMHIYLGMEEELLVVTRRHGQWQAESQLTGIQITCLASDPEQPERVYCGTSGSGLFRSKDAGVTWKPVGEGIGSENITAIAVSAVDRAKDNGVVYAGTELSAMFRSEDGGNTWRELGLAQRRPPWAWIIEWLIARPIPRPCDLVV
jgi:hypothetical protein